MMSIQALSSYQTRGPRHSGHGGHGQPPSGGGPSTEPTAPPPPQPDTITVATFNCENVFIGPPEPGHDQHDQPTKSPEAIAAAARVLGDLGADVVACQEVHDKKGLDAIADQVPGNPYKYRVLVPGNDERGINVAVLSKYPVTNVVTNAANRFNVGGKQEGFSRDFLEATIKVNDKFEFVMGTTHLKSHSGGQAANDKRLGEGREIHRILADELAKFPERRFIVCGDMNDMEDAPSMKAIIGNGPAELYNPLQGSHEISHPVTHRRIDFLLLSDNMKKAYVDDSEHVINDPNAAQASDHRPIIARFKIPQS